MEDIIIVLLFICTLILFGFSFVYEMKAVDSPDSNARKVADRFCVITMIMFAIYAIIIILDIIFYYCGVEEFLTCSWCCRTGRFWWKKWKKWMNNIGLSMKKEKKEKFVQIRTKMKEWSDKTNIEQNK